MHWRTSMDIDLRRCTSTDVDIRRHTSTYVNWRWHTSTYVNGRRYFLYGRRRTWCNIDVGWWTSMYVDVASTYNDVRRYVNRRSTYFNLSWTFFFDVKWQNSTTLKAKQQNRLFEQLSPGLQGAGKCAFSSIHFGGVTERKLLTNEQTTVSGEAAVLHSKTAALESRQSFQSPKRLFRNRNSRFVVRNGCFRFWSRCFGVQAIVSDSETIVLETKTNIYYSPSKQRHKQRVCFPTQVISKSFYFELITSKLKLRELKGKWQRNVEI